VNCGAIPENLMESEFFGYRRARSPGRMPIATASSRRLTAAPCSSTKWPICPDHAGQAAACHPGKARAQGRRPAEDPVDVRIISATHQNLKELVAAARFRQDLFYRLDVIELKMPSLRECREDIPANGNRTAAARLLGVTFRSMRYRMARLNLND
jgi:two-component system response regulator PilR (NtrC family)